MLPRFRSNSVRKVKGKGVDFPFRYVRKKARVACCPLCGVKLAVRQEGAKSKRIPSRAFGGVLCAKCSFDVLKLAGRVRAGHMKLDDVDMERRKFVKQMVKS
jgi:ribosomal protein L34E